MSNPLTRRALLRRGIPGIVAAGLAPQFISARLLGKSAPSNRLTIGLVGNGLICNAHAGTLLGLTDDCRVVATCDVVRAKAEKMREKQLESEAEARRAAREILAADPELKKPENARLRAHVERHAVAQELAEG